MSRSMRITSAGLVVLAALAVQTSAAAENCELKYSKTYDTCMDKSGGVTVSMLDCIAAETERQDKRLNANYQLLLKRFSPQRQAALRDAQRAWVKFRDAECLSRMDPEGGSAEGLVSNGCVLDLTIQRANDLESQRPVE